MSRYLPRRLRLPSPGSWRMIQAGQIQMSLPVKPYKSCWPYLTRIRCWQVCQLMHRFPLHACAGAGAARDNQATIYNYGSAVAVESGMLVGVASR